MGSSYAQQITPSEMARVVTGSNLTNYTESGGIGSGANYQEAGSVSIGGSLDTGARITGNTGTVTIGETGTANTFAQAVTQLFQSNADNTAKLFEMINAIQPPASPPAPAAESAPVEWAALWAKWQKTVMYAALGIAALVALAIWRPWKQ